MRVLVSAASRHGATAEIAAVIAATLREAGHTPVVLAPAAVTGLDGFDAAVIGSGIYAGHWLSSAKDLLNDHREALALMPVWLFSSGPIGDPPKPVGDPVDAEPLVRLVGAREHRVFAGELVRSRLGLAERTITAVVRAPEGDYRDWPAIEAWSREIAAAITPAATGTRR